MHLTNDKPVELPVMLSWQPEVADAVFQAVPGHLPPRGDDHPLDRHRPRTSDRQCFFGILVRS